MADTPKDPDEKGFMFAIFPVACSFVILAIAFFQNGKGVSPKFSIKSIEQAQNATAEQSSTKPVDMRLQVKECYASMNMKVSGLETATDKEVNDALYDCNQLKRRRG